MIVGIDPVTPCLRRMGPGHQIRLCDRSSRCEGPLPPVRDPSPHFWSCHG